jgi:hypothetical protein
LPPTATGIIIGLLVGLCLFSAVGVGVVALAQPSLSLPFLTPPTPTPVDPEQVLAAAQQAMAAITTYHYEMTASFQGLPATATTPQTVTLRLRGDVLLPDRYTMHTTEFGDLIVVGADAYLQNENEPGWRRRLASDASPGLAPTNPTALPRFLKFARDPIIGADIVSGTQRLHQINFVLDIPRMVQEEGPESTGAVLVGSRVTCDAQIGADDHRLYRLDVQLELPDNSNAATIQARFSEFNTPITIEPPPDVVP